ncbi:MAG: hypothetical protein JO317_09345 [Verrucomicrobiae bacterium]|nr:hypothetical protein [Verrucomicrobiae bacterium]
MNALLSSGLLAASLMLGQAEAPNQLQLTQGKIIVQDASPTPLQPAPMQAQPGQPQRPILGWFQREERPFLSKVGNWFKRGGDNQDGGQRGGVIRESAPPPLIAPSTSPNDFPRKLPSSQGQINVQPMSMNKYPTPTQTAAPKPLPLTPVNNPAPLKSVEPINMQAAAPKVKSPILPQFAEKMGRDERFEWITGQLEIEGNNYVIYYATPETVDKYNGRIFVVAQQNELNTFRRGDLISVRGQMTQRQTAQGIMPVYRIEQANLIERPR